MNNIFLSGRITRDIEVSYTTDQLALTHFTLAVGRRNDREKTDFIYCTAFGKTAEFMKNYLHKGSKIIVRGRWETGSYTNKEGVKVFTNTCIVEVVEFAESAKGQTPPEPRPAASNDPRYDGFDDVDADDLPF